MTTHAWRGIVLPAAILIAISGCASSTQTARKEADSHWRQVRGDVTRQMAQQQMEKGQTEQALATLRGALAANPNDAALHVLMARALFEQRDLNGAQAAVTRAQRLAPDLAEADYWQGVLAQSAGQWDEAHRAYQAAHAKDRESAEYLYALIEAKMALGQCQEAADLASSRFGDFPRDARLRSLAAGALSVEADPARAELLYQQALGLDPTNEEIKERLAQVLYREGKCDEAADLVEDLLAASGKNRGDLRMLLAACRLKAGQHAAAVEIFEQCAVENQRQPGLGLRLAEARLLAGQIARARQELAAMVDTQPNDARAWELLGHAWVLEGQLDAAQRAYEHAIAAGSEADRIEPYLRAIRGQQPTVMAGRPARAMAAMGISEDEHLLERTHDESGR